MVAEVVEPVKSAILTIAPTVATARVAIPILGAAIGGRSLLFATVIGRRTGPAWPMPLAGSLTGIIIGSPGTPRAIAMAARMLLAAVPTEVWGSAAAAMEAL